MALPRRSGPRKPRYVTRLKCGHCGAVSYFPSSTMAPGPGVLKSPCKPDCEINNLFKKEREQWLKEESLKPNSKVGREVAKYTAN